MNESGFIAIGNRGARLRSTDHEGFRELCALSTTTELDPIERHRLDEHLEACAECRNLKHQYEHVAENLRSAPRSSTISRPVPAISHRRRSIDQAPVRWTASAAVIMLAGLGGYEIGALGHRAPLGQGTGTTSAAVIERRQSKADDKPKVEGSELRSAIHQDSAKNAGLQKELTETRAALEKAERESGQLAIVHSNLLKQLESVRAEREVLEDRIATLTDQSASDSIQFRSDAAELKELRDSVESKNREIERAQALLERDRDIRGLIGARDLYIAEIYDVAKNGETQKPFGRVFYTKDKSLVFYGYDLDQQKDSAKDASFQVWGRRASSQSRDVSLGLLYQDDSKQNRWVLKFNDAKTISQMDAVFVTAEPEGGSTRPTGKQLLFTYLHIEPNHP